jgi:hypothetical protein
VQDVYSFTPDQVRRFKARFGPFDADHRMRMIGYQYIAARAALERPPREPAGPRTFLFRPSWSAASPADTVGLITYPHVDEPWRLFKRDATSIQYWDNSSTATGSPASVGSEWVDVCKIDQLAMGKWVAVTTANGDQLPLRLLHADTGEIYGAWL